LFAAAKSGYCWQREMRVNDRPTDPQADPRQSNDEQVADMLLARALRRAWWTITWERLWPALASLAVALGVFLAASWAGLWLVLPPMGRAIALFILVVLIAVAAVPLLRFRLPSTFDGLRRLDRGSGLKHRPATALADELASGENDQVSAALWRAHVEQAVRAANALKAGTPRPRLPVFDPIAVRALVVLLVAATFFAASGERVRRITAAFDWAGVVQAKNFRVDAWVTPPAYTAKPPVILPGIRAGEPHQAALIQTVPTGSVLVIRASGASRLDIVTSGGLAEASREGAPTPPAGTEEHRYVITDRGHPRSRADHRTDQGARAAGARIAATRLQDGRRLRRGRRAGGFRAEAGQDRRRPHAAPALHGAGFPAGAAAGAHPQRCRTDHEGSLGASLGRRRGDADA
jgi:hypothetical protein